MSAVPEATASSRAVSCRAVYGWCLVLACLEWLYYRLGQQPLRQIGDLPNVISVLEVIEIAMIVRLIGRERRDAPFQIGEAVLILTAMAFCVLVLRQIPLAAALALAVLAAWRLRKRPSCRASALALLAFIAQFVLLGWPFLVLHNVVGLLEGSDPALKSEYVVISAHLDHVGVGKPDAKGDTIYNGAMDNAVGTGSMLEVARAFAASGKKPRRSILFVAVTAEEKGLVGSDYFAANPVVPAAQIVADVNLDMPILLYDFQDVVAFGAEQSTLGPIVERAAAKMGVTLSPDPMPAEQLFLRSDHYSFVKAGVPSVFLVTGFKNGGEKAFRDFLKTNYHKVSDDLKQPFDWKAGAKFAKINYLIAREIADADQEPRWYEGNSFGERFAKDAPKAPRPAGVPARTPAPVVIPGPAPAKN